MRNGKPEEENLEDLGIDGIVTLIWISKKQSVRVWTTVKLIQDGVQWSVVQFSSVQFSCTCAFFKSAPLHEGVTVEWRYSSTYS